MSTALLDAEAVDVPDEYELVNGQLVETPSMSAYAVEIANRLARAMYKHEPTDQLGAPRIEMHFRVPTRRDPAKVRRPDLAFVTYETWPQSEPMMFTGNPMNVVPELVVEVESPTDNGGELLKKMRQYLSAGVRSVWLVYPSVQEIHCYEGRESPRTYGIEDTLDGGPMLPGFQVKLADLFPPIVEGSIPEPKNHDD